jgi:AAA+ superfamily predicted ATPase
MGRRKSHVELAEGDSPSVGGTRSASLYATAADEIADNLPRLHRLLRHASNRFRLLRISVGGRGLDGIAIFDGEIDAFLEREPWNTLRPAAARPGQNGAGDFRQTIDLDRLHCETLATASAAAGADLRLHGLRGRFGLSSIEVDICLMCLAPEIDPGYGRFYAYLHNDISRARPTVALTLDLFAEDWRSRAHTHRLLAGEGALASNGLIEILGSRGNPLESELALKTTVVRYLLGAPVRHILSPDFGGDADLSDLILAEKEHIALGRLNEYLAEFPARADDPLIVVIRGPEGSGKRSIAAALARNSGAQPFLFRCPDLDAGRLAGLRDWTRTVRMVGGWPVADISCSSASADLLAPEVASIMAESGCGCGFLLAEAQTRIRTYPERQLRHVTVDLGVPPPSLRRAAWARFLGEEGVRCDDADISATASIFAFSPGRIRRAAREAGARLRLASGAMHVNSQLLNEICRGQSDHRLGQIAERLSATRNWTELVLPPDELDRLREIAAAVRNREQVMERWDFAGKLGSGPGVNALFFGPSGTGKTMAASILANDLGMELYRVDLSRVVSKYIGETEKNLDGLFVEARRAHAIVFFDEAEALFGKRSEVKDAHDRYSNIEVAYLLQRMEAFEGVAILATNLRKNMDNAFLRRLQFAVEFPKPSLEQRLEIWRRIWPKAAAVEDGLDLEFMARSFEVTGGHIRNIALMAAYLAAQDGVRIAMSHLVAATRREFQKLGRLCVAEEFGKYQHLLRFDHLA